MVELMVRVSGFWYKLVLALPIRMLFVVWVELYVGYLLMGGIGDGDGSWEFYFYRGI